jgi:hypothetical protein
MGGVRGATATVARRGDDADIGARFRGENRGAGTAAQSPSSSLPRIGGHEFIFAVVHDETRRDDTFVALWTRASASEPADRVLQLV